VAAIVFVEPLPVDVTRAAAVHVVRHFDSFVMDGGGTLLEDPCVSCFDSRYLEKGDVSQSDIYR
jgi:hypothetical protein